MNDQKREYMKNYYRKYWKTHPEQYKKHKELVKKERLNLRVEIEKKIGNRCVICGSQEKLSFHEINGKPHYNSHKDSQEKYYLDNWQDFIPLCQKHHRFIHFLAKTLHSEAELEKAIEIIKRLL